MDIQVISLIIYIILVIVLVELYYRYRYLPRLKRAAQNGYTDW